MCHLFAPSSWRGALWEFVVALCYSLRWAHNFGNPHSQALLTTSNIFLLKVVRQDVSLTSYKAYVFIPNLHLQLLFVDQLLWNCLSFREIGMFWLDNDKSKYIWASFVSPGCQDWKWIAWPGRTSLIFTRDWFSLETLYLTWTRTM
jgi:hypothetical protein